MDCGHKSRRKARDVPFDAKRLPTTEVLPFLHDPGYLLPAEGAAMPHIVDPHGTSLFRLLLRVNTCIAQTLLEDRICQPEIGPDPTVEGVVGGVDVCVAKAELPGILSTTVSAARARALTPRW